MRTPDSPENYNAYKGRQRQQDEKRQTFQAVTRLEDDASSPLSDAQISDHVAELTGSKPAPEDMVKANRELFREAVDHVWAGKLRESAPITLAMLSDPNSKPISRSDADTFAAIEQTANKIGNGPTTMGDRALGRGIQLASALIAGSGPRGSAALPPFPLPKPPSSALSPLPLPKPLPPVPLPKPENSTAVTASPEAKEGTGAPAASAPTAAPAERMSPAAPPAEGAGQPSVPTGPGAQTGASGNAAGVPGGASAQSGRTVPPSAKAGGQGAAATAPAEEVNPNANTTGAAGTPPVQAAPAAGRAAGQAVAFETSTGQVSGTGTTGVVAPAPDKATQAAPLTIEGAEQGSPSAGTGQAPSDSRGGAAQNIGQPETPASADLVGQGEGLDDRLILDAAFAKGRSPEERNRILGQIPKLAPFLQFRLMDMYEAALNGVDPAELVGDLSPKLREMYSPLRGLGSQSPARQPEYIFWGHSVNRGIWEFYLDLESASAELAIMRHQDKLSSPSKIFSESVGLRFNEEKSLLDYGLLMAGETGTAHFVAESPESGAYLALGRIISSRISSAFGVDEIEVAKKNINTIVKIQQNIDALPMSPEASRFEDAMGEISKDPSLSNQASRLVSLARQDPRGLVFYMTEKGMENIPFILVSAIATGITKDETLGIAILTEQAYLQTRSAEALKAIERKGYILKKPGEIDRLFQNPDIILEASRQGGRKAFWSALVQAASGGLSKEILSKNPIIDEFGKQLANPILSAGGEAVGEISSGQKISVPDVAMAAAVEFAKGGLSLGAEGLAKGAEITVGQATAFLAKAQKGGHNYAVLEKMIKDPEAAKLRVEDTEAYARTLGSMLEGKPGENIFIRFRDLNSVVKRLGIDEDQLLAELKGVTAADLAAAREANGDIRIPTAVYLAYIAHTSIGKELTPLVRVGADEVSGAEALVIHDRLAQIFSDSKGGGGKVPDATPSGPSRTRSQGSDTSANGETTTGGSEPKVAPNQSGTLTVGGEKFLNSTSPAFVQPDLTAVTPQVVPQSQKKPQETIEQHYPVKDYRGHQHIPPGQDPKIGRPSKKGPKPKKSEDDAYKETSKKFPVQEEKLKLPPVNQTPGLFLRQR